MMKKSKISPEKKYVVQSERKRERAMERHIQKKKKSTESKKKTSTDLLSAQYLREKTMNAKSLQRKATTMKKHTPNEINRKKIKKINVKLTTTGDGVYNNNKKNTNQINNTLRE